MNNDDLLVVYANNKEAIDKVWVSLPEEATLRDAIEQWQAQQRELRTLRDILGKQPDESWPTYLLRLIIQVATGTIMTIAGIASARETRKRYRK